MSSMQYYNSIVGSQVKVSGDNVGIGTSNPTGTLDVSGIIIATSGNSTQWNTAYGWGDHSTSGYLTAHPNISSASSSNNSGQVFIQDVLLDTNGHVTGLETAIASGGSGINSLFEDKSPQLGGNLDLNSHDITGVPGADFKIGYEAGFFPHHDGYTLVTDTTNRKVGINTNGFQSYALDIGKGVNVTTTSDMRVEQIVPHVSLLLGTNHSSSTLSPQGGMTSPACIGNGAAPTTSKALNFATNYFSTAGDAQKVTMAVQYESTDASTYYLNAGKTGGYAYGSAIRNDMFHLPVDSSATFTIHLIANNDTDGTSAGWIFRGCIKSVNRSLSFVGSPITENFTDSGMSGATAVLEAQGPGTTTGSSRMGALVIKVNGLAGKTIRWVATVDAVLTSF